MLTEHTFPVIHDALNSGSIITNGTGGLLCKAYKLS